MTAPQPRWKRLHPDQRREQILLAAREAFTHHPYGEASLAEIARAAGVSRGLVTHYFGPKRDLFLAVQQEALKLGESAIRGDLGLPIESTVERNVSAWLDFAEANQNVALSLNSFVSRDADPQADELVARTRDRVVDTMLANHFGTIDVPDEARLVLRAYTGLTQVAVADWLRYGRATREQVQTLMVHALLALIREVVPALRQ